MSESKGIATAGIVIIVLVLLTALVTSQGVVKASPPADMAGMNMQAQGSATGEVEITPILRAALGCVLTYRDSSEGGVFSYQRAEIFARLGVSY